MSPDSKTTECLRYLEECKLAEKVADAAVEKFVSANPSLGFMMEWKKRDITPLIHGRAYGGAVLSNIQFIHQQEIGGLPFSQELHDAIAAYHTARRVAQNALRLVPPEGRRFLPVELDR